WEALLEQHKRTVPSGQVTDEWKKTNKKLLLDQMVEEKLLLQEAKRKNIKVPKRQLEEGVLQVKNRFKNTPTTGKPTKEDYERGLTSQEQTEFDKELKKQGITEKEFSDRIEDQLRVMRLTEEEIRSRVPSPLKNPAADADDENQELTPDYEKE